MIEFILLAVVVMVPLCSLVVGVFEVQRAAFGATAATREAARVFVRAPSSAVGEQRAAEAAGVTLLDHGIELDPNELSISCSATPCLTPGESVRVTYRTRVSLPFLPGFLAGDLASIPITATHTQVVDQYSETRP